MQSKQNRVYLGVGKMYINLYILLKGYGKYLAAIVEW